MCSIDNISCSYMSYFRLCFELIIIVGDIPKLKFRHKMTITQREKVADGDDDPVESMLKKTGCLELHYKVQECIATTKDWRLCQSQVNDFKNCINKHKQLEMSKSKT